MAVNAQELRRHYDAAVKDRRPGKFFEDLRTGLEKKHLRAEDFSIRQLFEQFVPNGYELIQTSMNPNKPGGYSTRLLEATGAVDTSVFTNITGQVMYTRMLDKFNAPEFVMSKTIETVPTQFNGERIPGIGAIGDAAEIVGEGKDYPLVGLTEDWIDTPQTLKRGMIIPFTKEALFFDRTGVVLSYGDEIATWLGLNKEKRLINAVIDENTTLHRMKWKGTSYASYQAATPWINIKSSNGFTNWVNVDAAEQVFAQILDPNTGEPIIITPNTIICAPDIKASVMMTLRATAIRTTSPGFATSGSPVETETANPIGSYNVISSPLIRAAMATKTTWYMGDPSKAVKYMENFPLTVERAPAGNDDEFKKDIVVQFKASERGAASTWNPRYMVKNTVA